MPHIGEDQISAYIDKQLDVEKNLAVEAHLQDCKDCRAVFEGMRELTRLFREAERAAPPAFLWNRIAADFDNKERTPTWGWGAAIMAGLRRYRGGLGTAAAVMTLLLAVGITVFHENARQVAERAALATIDQTHKSLAAQDPDAYNPFSSKSLRDLDVNPFRSLRLSGRTDLGK